MNQMTQKRFVHFDSKTTYLVRLEVWGEFAEFGEMHINMVKCVNRVYNIL